MKKILWLLALCMCCFGQIHVEYESNSIFNVTNSSSDTLRNYQAEIDLDSNNFNFVDAKSDGSDIIVTDVDTNLIPYSVLSYDSASMVGVVAVRVPQILPSGSTTVIVWYKNDSPQFFEVPPLGPFTKSTLNPILPATTGAGLLPEDIVYDSATSKWYMVFEDRRAAPPWHVGIASATDLDGAWTIYGSPISSPGAGSGKNGDPVNAPCLLRYNGKWLLYRGDQLYLDTSSSITGPYVPYSASPVVASPSTTGLWNTARVTEPHIFYDSIVLNKWVMFCMGDESFAMETVGYYTAESPYGPWTEYTHNPVVDYGAANTYDAGLTADPHVFFSNGTYYIFYVAGRSGTTYNKTCYYTTKDFVNFQKGNVVLNPGKEFGWDYLRTFRGTITKYNNAYYLSYAGDKVPISNLFQGGLAKQSALSTISGFPPQQVYGVYDVFAGTTLNSFWSHKLTNGGSGTCAVSDGTVKITSGTFTSRIPFSKLQSGYEISVGEMIETKIKTPKIDTVGNFGMSVGFGDESLEITRGFDLVTGKFDNAIKFNSSYINFKNPVALRQQNNLTVEAWVKVSKYNHQTLTYILGKHPGWAFGVWGDGLLFANFNNGSVVKATNGAFTVSDTGTWVHIAFSYDGSSVKLFKNGTQLTTSGSFASTITTTNDFVIGSRTDKEWYFSGSIDEVRISDTVRYTSSFTPKTEKFSSDSRTAALLRFDELLGTGIFYDSTANHCDGYSSKGYGAFIRAYKNKNLTLSTVLDETASDSIISIVVDTTAHVYKIWWKSLSQVCFKVDSSDWITLNKSIPSGTYPMFIKSDAVTNNTIPDTVVVDYVKVMNYSPDVQVGGEPVTPNPHIDTLIFTCSVEGAISWQWYITNSTVTDSLIVGATDSVITIYADSAFYANKPTVYCTVSNGVDTFVGFEWSLKNMNLLQRAIGRLRERSRNR